jgi:hypothetical protein
VSCAQGRRATKAPQSLTETITDSRTGSVWRALGSYSTIASCGVELMTCKSCNSENQRRFNSEINVHLPGLKNLDKAPVLYFPSFWSVLTAVLQNLPFQRSHCFYLEETSRHPGPEHARHRVGFLTYRVSTRDCPSAVAKSKSANLLLTNRLP